jgi:class I lanthipeptide synthase
VLCPPPRSRRVFLTERDRLLKLDLGQSAQLALLRAHLNSGTYAVLTAGAAGGTHGWFDGRAHEFVVGLTAAQPAGWPGVPPVTESRVIGRDHGLLPGASTWLLAKLYGHVTRQAEILAEYLPQLWSQWDEPPA